MTKFIDPDYDTNNNCQLYLIDRIEKRLNSEHKGAFEKTGLNHFILK